MTRIRQTLKQIVQAFRMTRERDEKLIRYLLIAGLVAAFLAALIGLLLLSSVVWFIVLLILLVPLAVMFTFGRRLQNLQDEVLKGQPGAAAAVVQSMKGWYVTPVIALTRNQDFVHRAVGPGGVVLIGEGKAQRVDALLKLQQRKHSKIAGDVTITVFKVGDAEGQIPVSDLRMKMMRLPRVLKPKTGAIRELHLKLEAVAGTDIPMPKGAIPTQRKGPR